MYQVSHDLESIYLTKKSRKFDQKKWKIMYNLERDHI